MKVAIISDIHANYEALQSTLQAIAAHTVDHILCLGDIVGYNADPAECIELLRGFGALCIAGNHDRAVTGQITTEGFPYIARRAVTWTRSRLSREARGYLADLPVELSLPKQIVAVHGALHPEMGKETVRLDNDEDRRLSLAALIEHPSGARICAFGHTHQLGIFELRGGIMRELTRNRIFLHDDGWYLINPGTVGQPRSKDQRATYVVVDLAQNEITTHYVEYDASVPFTRTRNAGLLPFWLHLLEPIRSFITCLPRPVRSALRRGIEIFQR